MTHAFETRDADALRAGAHSLKSSSANVGAMRMSALCRKIEDLARSGSVENTAKDVVDLSREYQKVTQELAGHWGKRRSN
jgi:HPt (histidine-containing phosphotransfer) domain-containing protein